ncbi:MAG: sugar transferase [Cyanobacteriota bacterium]|nr:sugar transferase [Cyanobacteriota bacterium]
MNSATFLYPIPHPSIHSPFKRAIDILGSVVGLTIFALLFVPIAISIQLDSPGPVFFSQKRCGLYGQPFTIYKFRSMVPNAEALRTDIPNQATGHIFKNARDTRITRVGRFLRRTSLDEFPQFWNVLRGEMSLVGTRPPTPDEVRHYHSRHWQRLNVRPGLTGEWQVNGRSQVTDFEAVVNLDLRYQQRWTLGYDLILLVKTLYVVFARVGAC